MINPHGSSDEVPKVADFLGVSKSDETQSDHHHQLVTYNEIQAANESDYLFQNNSLVPLPNSLNVAAAAAGNYHEFQESANNLQSLTLSMGTTGNKGSSSTCETTTAGDNTSTNTSTAVEATPRRTLDTFGQRTSIYRGVTR